MGKLHRHDDCTSHLLKPHPCVREWRAASPHPPAIHIHIVSGLWKLSMGVVSMATDHSTEATAKLLKAIHPETDTLWVLCVDLCV